MSAAAQAAPPAPPTPMVRTARTAVFTAFALNGAAFAAFASRVPDIKHQLDLTAGELGLTLLAASLGSVIGLPISGWLVHRFGAARSLIGAAVVQAAGILLVGAGIDVWQNRVLVSAGLFLVGIGTGIFDVSMNLEGASVERLLGRSIMPRFHAAFSGGTVVSALIGAGLSYLHVPVAAHLAGVVVLMAIICPWFLRAFLPRSVEVDEHEGDAEAGTGKAGIGAAWREPRTLLIGVVVLAAAFTEGTANDWVGVALSDGYALPRWAGVLGFAVFLTAMTAGRLFGTKVLDRHGRLPVLRVLFVSAVVGCALVVFGGPVLAFVGAAVWGVGASLGFPVGMSAAADDPRRAAARMSVVSTIGYTAFLAGPPLLGFLGDHVGVLHSLLVVGAMAVVALAALPAVRERPSSDTEAPSVSAAVRQ
ncbi:membrane protein [Intrasporangium oryzae NRRL B-24470]|uniref:Membrane protein n=1 Tax=Intrasporangium oryzae NRRL B-24470 TaxID=1386089 RepID=W9G7W3_9MICO|nr:MFS transporter [Intrasporangium oryzae]EWS99953.1 membrane protein [Intrasporangium oryzae NRRL B-24470]